MLALNHRLFLFQKLVWRERPSLWRNVAEEKLVQVSGAFCAAQLTQRQISLNSRRMRLLQGSNDSGSGAGNRKHRERDGGPVTAHKLEGSVNKRVGTRV